jgi:hypothetical protein
MKIGKINRSFMLTPETVEMLKELKEKEYLYKPYGEIVEIAIEKLYEEMIKDVKKNSKTKSNRKIAI